MPGGSSPDALANPYGPERPLKRQSYASVSSVRRATGPAQQDRQIGVGPAASLSVLSAFDAATAYGPRVTSSPMRPPEAHEQLAPRPRLSILTIPTKPSTTHYCVSDAQHTSHVWGAMDTGCSVTGRPGKSPRVLRAVKRPDAPQGRPDDAGYWPGSRRRSV